MNGQKRADATYGSLVVEPSAFVDVANLEMPPHVDEANQQELRERFAFVLVDSAGSETVGGSGLVVGAYDARGERFALKRLRLPQRESGLSAEECDRINQRGRKAFREEFMLLSRLASFSQFPDVYGFGEVEGVPAIFMEWVEGASLEQLLQESGSPDARDSYCAHDVALVGRSLFNVLQVLDQYGRGFVHRDLSPANIMVRTSRMSVDEQIARHQLDLCLIDFGTSALTAQSGGVEVSCVPMRGTTPEYAPPEILANSASCAVGLCDSPKVDVYAACSVLYELLWGDTPFRLYAEGPCDSAQFKIEHEPCRDLPVARDAATALDGIISQGLAAHQNDRPDASVMTKAFERFLEAFAWCDMRSEDRMFPAPVDALLFFPPDYGVGNRALSDDEFNKNLAQGLELRDGFGRQKSAVEEKGVGERLLWRAGRHFTAWMLLLIIVYTIAVLNVGYELHGLLSIA